MSFSLESPLKIRANLFLDTYSPAVLCRYDKQNPVVQASAGLGLILVLISYYQ